MSSRVLLLWLCGFFLLASLPCSAGRAGEPLRVENFELQDFRGKHVALEDFEQPIVVVAFLGVECPLVKLYANRLVEMQEKHRDQGVAFVAINSNQQDSLAEMAHFARANKIDFPLLKDPGNRVADQFQAERAPEVFVLDQQRRVRYRGRIDDQYTYGLQRPKVFHNYLAEALDQLVAGKEVAVSKTEAVGCHIGRVLKPHKDSEITYSNQIARIFQRRCVQCHRPGEIAPFALTEYEEVVGWAEMIAEVVRQQRMPPWHASAEYGEFINDARLTDKEKQQIYDWVAAGAPEGDPAQLPPPREFSQDWQIGEPDMIIPMADKPFHVKEEGEVKYQYFVVDPGFKEDKWVQGAECRPDNRAVVHHIIVAVKPPGRGRKVTVHGDLSSEWLAATAPGARPMMLPEGLGKRIPAGSKLVFQMHYTPIGTPQEDLSSVGLIFADPDKVQKEVVTQNAVNTRFRIPPGHDNYRVEAAYRFKHDMLLLAMFPHMHLRGKSFVYKAIYPTGGEEILLDVPQYDFNWQNSYILAQPKRMPAGTILHCVAHFDNSEDNLANPDPTVTVRWGDQTWDEMMIGYFDAVLADQDLTKQAANRARTEQFDKNAKLNDHLRSLARQALVSESNLMALAIRLREILPQLDRVCLTSVKDDRLTVEMAAQEPSLREQLGGKGISIRASGTALAAHALERQPVTHANVRECHQDLHFMARGLSSSVHVPIEHQGRRATVNFWSTEEEAFPPQAVSLCEEAAKLMKP